MKADKVKEATPGEDTVRKEFEQQFGPQPMGRQIQIMQWYARKEGFEAGFAAGRSAIAKEAAPLCVAKCHIEGQPPTSSVKQMKTSESDILAFCEALKDERVRTALERLRVDSKVDLVAMLSAPAKKGFNE